MDIVKIDDPRLDESFSFLFAFRKGDAVLIKAQRESRGEITDGVYIGDFPKHVAGVLNPRGLTLYEVKTANDVLQIVDEKELQKVS